MLYFRVAEDRLLVHAECIHPCQKPGNCLPTRVSSNRILEGVVLLHSELISEQTAPLGASTR